MRKKFISPVDALIDFLDCYHLETAIHILDQLFDCALGSEEADHLEHNERCSMIFFYRQIEHLLIAIYALEDTIEHIQIAVKIEGNEEIF